MPNWCVNQLKVRFPTPDHENYFYQVFGDGEPFRRLIPEPDWSKIPNAQGELPKKHRLHSWDEFPDGTKDTRWHEWRFRNWGTKWDVFKEDIYMAYCYDPEPMAVVEFLTIWCPPTAIVNDLRARGFYVEWYYREPGMGEKGYV